MKIAFVLDRPELCGGVKVVLQDAELLHQRQVSVTVFAVGPLPEWSCFSGDYVNIENAEDTTLAKVSFDLVIATFWTTVLSAEKMNMGPIVHYCQGYEASYPHLLEQINEINQVYAKPYPCFTVSQYLANLLSKRFGKSSFVIPPPVDPLFEPIARAPISPPFNIMVSGIFECTWKGVETSLRTVRKLRNSGVPLKLTRISLLPQSQLERDIFDADYFYHHVEPEKVAELTARADLVLFASQKEEGFGLPLVEALACGVPCISANIESAQEITRSEFPLVEPLDVDGFYQHALSLLSNPKLWLERSELGIQLTKPYRSSIVSDRLISGLNWALTKHLEINSN